MESFNLLLPDGAVKVTFEPPLDTQHYDALLRLARKVESSRELESELTHVAPLWGVVTFRIEAA